MPNNYERVFRSLQAGGGQHNLWELLWPREGQLTKLILIQTGGNMVNFTLNVFNSRQAASHSVSSGGSNPDGEYVADPEHYRVVPEMVQDQAGRLLKYFDDNVGYFINQDARGPTNKLKRIYVEILPAGVETTSWDLTLACIMNSKQ